MGGRRQHARQSEGARETRARDGERKTMKEVGREGALHCHTGREQRKRHKTQVHSREGAVPEQVRAMVR